MHPSWLDVMVRKKKSHDYHHHPIHVVKPWTPLAQTLTYAMKIPNSYKKIHSLHILYSIISSIFLTRYNLHFSL